MRNLPGNQTAVLGVLDQGDQERQVGVGTHVLDEERHPPVDEELLQDHVPHGHRQRRVGAGLGGQPLVGELGVVGVVRADRDDLGAAVAHLGHPVRVRRPGDRHVGAPHHQIGGVPPVAGLRHVGLVAEDLRAGHRQVGVPVVEGGHHPAEQLGEAGADAVGDHRHRRNRREAGDPVRPVGLDRVHVRRGDHLHRLGPAGPDQAALAAGRLVAPAPLPDRWSRRPRPAPGRRAAAWPPGTSPAARPGCTGSGPGWGSRCTRRRRRRAGSREARTRDDPDPPTGSRSAATPR